MLLSGNKFTLLSPEKPREACFDPGNIMNASRTGYDYKLGSQVSYNCHHGYITVGGDTITCVMGNDGKPVWDKALPSCKGRGLTYLWQHLSIQHLFLLVKYILSIHNLHTHCIRYICPMFRGVTGVHSLCPVQHHHHLIEAKDTSVFI